MAMMKFVLPLFLTIILTACGFSPMYGSGAGSSGFSATAGLDKIDIALIPDESGVYLRNILIDDFYQNGYPSAPTHRLEISKIMESEHDLDITQQSEATRKQVRLMARMTLRDLSTSKPVLDRSFTALTSYNVLGSQFTTRVSENDAREAALADLARQIENQVALYFKR